MVEVEAKKGNQRVVMTRWYHIKAAEDHSCFECTKPFKESVTNTTIHPDAAPVKMVVVDGIVMGPTVSF